MSEDRSVNGNSFYRTTSQLRVRCFSLAVLILFSSSMLAPSVAAEQRGTCGPLRLLFWQAPTTTNPHLSIGIKDLSASRIVYEPLASFDADGGLIPLLAAEIPSPENGGVAADGRSVTWKLKPNLKWADGAPFTADDVLFTFEYASSANVGATSRATYRIVRNVEVIDDLTVKVHFKDVNPAWALPFVGVNGMIIPRHLFEKYAGANAQDAPENLKGTGTGAYRVVKFTEEDILIIGEDVVSTIKIVYEPNPFFRELDKPCFERVALQGGGDALTAAKAVFRDGVVDYGYNLQVAADILQELEAQGKGTLIAPPTAKTERIMINFSDPNRETGDGERSSVKFPHPFLTDKRVRQAISLGIDRKAISKLYGKVGRVATNMLISPARYNSPNTTWEFNLEKAASILDQAGWIDTDGDGVREKNEVRLSMVFQTSVNSVRQKTQQIIKNALESIGFEVELKIIDASIFFGPVRDNTNTRRHFYADLEEFTFNNKSPDPGAYLRAWTCGAIAQKANNWSAPNWPRYCNPEFDVLYEQSATELDSQKRRRLIVQMNDFLINDFAVIPIVERSSAFGISNDLVGVEPTPWDVDVWNIKDWRRK
ncbi:MAG: peptide ABC transporter substrate-binding protein [Anaerolineales bacterium]|nr:peptide ABC transporter substrate-binding protein [Anaerolineales bacterium]